MGQVSCRWNDHLFSFVISSDDQSQDSSQYEDDSVTIYKQQNPVGLYMLAFSYDCPAISKLFLIKRYFHEAFMSSALFPSNDKDDFSKYLVRSFGDIWRLRIPEKVKEIFKSHRNIAKSTASIRMSSYQNAKRNLSTLIKIMIDHETHDEKNF